MYSLVTTNLQIKQGTTFRQQWTWKTGDPLGPVDLSECTARCQFRQKVTAPTVLLDLTTENGGIVLGGSSGTVELVVLPEQTAGVTWRDAVYDLEIYFGPQEVVSFAEGSVKLAPEVTRD